MKHDHFTRLNYRDFISVGIEVRNKKVQRDLHSTPGLLLYHILEQCHGQNSLYRNVGDVYILRFDRFMPKDQLRSD